MSNLGGYQTITTLIKALGGPKKASAIIGSGILGIGVALGWGVKASSDAIRGKIAKAKDDNLRASEEYKQIYTIRKSVKDCSQSARLKPGTQFHVIQQDGDTVVVEIIGDDNNPYPLSRAFLRSVSDLS